MLILGCQRDRLRSHAYKRTVQQQQIHRWRWHQMPANKTLSTRTLHQPWPMKRVEFGKTNAFVERRHRDNVASQFDWSINTTQSADCIEWTQATKNSFWWVHVIIIICQYIRFQFNPYLMIILHHQLYLLSPFRSNYSRHHTHHLFKYNHTQTYCLSIQKHHRRHHFNCWNNSIDIY